MELKELRISKGLTQKQSAEYLQIPLRTYVNYENDAKKRDSMKYRFMVGRLKEYGFIDENHGLLTVEDIKRKCEKIFDGYAVEYCYLFGSYAKGSASEQSDVDLLVSTSLTGFDFYELAENLRVSLGKKIDLLNQNQIKNNFELLQEILKEGIKIYG